MPVSLADLYKLFGKSDHIIPERYRKQVIPNAEKLSRAELGMFFPDKGLTRFDPDFTSRMMEIGDANVASRALLPEIFGDVTSPSFIPDVPQIAYPRYKQTGLRPVNQSLVDNLPNNYLTPLSDMYRGLALGGHRWYGTHPVLSSAIKAYGGDVRAGTQAFRDFIAILGASSAVKPVSRNVRVASHLYKNMTGGNFPWHEIKSMDDAARYLTQEAGNPSKFANWYTAPGSKIAKANFSPPYRSNVPAMDLYHASRALHGIRQGNPLVGHLRNLATQSGGHKTPTFIETLLGNLAMWVGDTHEGKALWPEAPKGFAEKKIQIVYPWAEDATRKWAGDVGLLLPQFQGARWTGGAPRTGVESADQWLTFPHGFQDMILRQAKRRRISDPGEMARQFWNRLDTLAMGGEVGPKGRFG